MPDFFPQWAQFADGFDPAPPAWHLIQGRFIRIGDVMERRCPLCAGGFKQLCGLGSASQVADCEATAEKHLFLGGF